MTSRDNFEKALCLLLDENLSYDEVFSLFNDTYEHYHTDYDVVIASEIADVFAKYDRQVDLSAIENFVALTSPLGSCIKEKFKHAKDDSKTIKKATKSFDNGYLSVASNYGDVDKMLDDLMAEFGLKD